MGLNKYGPGKWEDISGWSTAQLEAKYTELKVDMLNAAMEYCEHLEWLNEQCDYLLDELSRRVNELDTVL